MNKLATEPKQNLADLVEIESTRVLLILVLNLDVTKFSILMRSKFSGSHASLNIVTLCSEYVCTCHDMTLYGRVTLLVHTGERLRVWYGRVSHGIFTGAGLG